MGSWNDKTLALAGIFQATSLVKDLATTGLMEQHDFDTCIASIFETDPASTELVYGDSLKLQTGLKVLIEQLDNNEKKRNIDIARYVISLLHLQGKLAKNKQMMDQLANGIDRAKAQSEHFSITHENVIANLAGIYSDTVSTIQPKIMVSGEERFLSNTTLADKIRALLLAGMRSAVLWNQLGGSRWQILLQRKRLIREAKNILSNTHTLH
jgi:high frequency lysogenization protein